MESLICRGLDEPTDAKRGLRLALRMAAHIDAKALALIEKYGPERITKRIWLIETLEACKTVGEWFWRDCVIRARETMEREKS